MDLDEKICKTDKVTAKEIRGVFDKLQIPYDPKSKKDALVALLDTLCSEFGISRNNCEELSCLLQDKIKSDYATLSRVTNLSNAVLKGYEVLSTSSVEDTHVKKQSPLFFDKAMEHYMDPTQELKDVMTNLTTDHFLKDQENVSNYIEIIFKLMNQAITYYRKQKGLKPLDIVFIYKGGNALKAVFLKYLYELPGSSADHVYDTFHPYFKKSDADFQIYVNPKLSNWDSVYDDMISLAYLVVNRLRMIFQLHGMNFFDFYQYNNDLRADILDATLQQLNKTNILKDKEFIDNPKLVNHKYLHGLKFVGLKFRNELVTNATGFDPKKITKTQLLAEPDDLVEKYEKYVEHFGRSDILIVDHPTDPANKTQVLKISPLYEQQVTPVQEKYLKFDTDLQQAIDEINPGNEMFISVNKAISFQKENFTLSFALVRMKVNFTAFFKNKSKYGLLNLPGELIDIAIPHRKATEMDRFYENINDYVANYNYVGRFGVDKSFPFKSYTVEYYIKDLQKMLYLEQKYPWNNEKYEKRLYRLFFLYLVDMLRQLGPEKSLEILKDFIVPFKQEPPPRHVARSNQRAFSNALLDTKLHKYPDLAMYFFLDKLLQFTGRVAETDRENYGDFQFSSPEAKEFITNIESVLGELISVVENLLKFMRSGKIEKSHLRKQYQL